MENKNLELALNQRSETQVLSPTQTQVAMLRQELSLLIREQVNAHCIDEREALLLSLRLGLLDGTCATLQKIGEMLNLSPEWVRQRQYFLLKKKITDPHFFARLKEYSRLFHLPRGIRPRQD